MAYNCLDRHILNGFGDETALIWESSYLKKQKYISYKETQAEVSKLCKILIEKGLKPGDRSVIYMSMITEAIFSVLACARLGVIHSVVFRGFADDELAARIKNAEPKVVASIGIETKKQIPNYPMVRHAFELLRNLNIPILLVQRDSHIETDIKMNTIVYNGRIDKMNNDDYDIKPAEMESTDSLYILYTSGTTGTPKGIVRDIGDTCVALNYAKKMVLIINRGDVYFATPDIGWVVGHSFIVYGPLLRGATADKPLPGYDVRIYHQEDGDEITHPITFGNILIKLPMPPSFMTTLWKNDNAFAAKCITKDNQYYITGDAGYFDENGYLHILTRVDDVINVAGNRLSTGRIEVVVDDIVGPTVVSMNHELKGTTLCIHSMQK